MRTHPLLLLTFPSLIFSCKNTPPVPEYASYDEYPVYPGDDLAMTYSPDATTFKLYSPAAEEARVHL